MTKKSVLCTLLLNLVLSAAATPVISRQPALQHASIPNQRHVSLEQVAEPGVFVNLASPRTDMTPFALNAPGMRTVPRQAAAGTVNLSLEFDADSVKIGSLTLYSDSVTGQVQIGATSKGGTMDLAPGNYMMVAIFYHYTKGYTGRYNNLNGLTYIIKENVQVTAGSSVDVSIKVADATNHYKVHNILPDGNEAKLSDYKYTSKKDYTVVTEGNALYVAGYSTIFSKKYGQVMWVNYASKGNILPNTFRNSSDINDFLVFNVNDVSDELIIGVESVVNTGTDSKNKKDLLIEHFDLPSVAKANGEFRNVPANYSVYSLPVVQTQPGRDSQYQSTMGLFSANFDKYYKGRKLGGMSMIAQNINMCEAKASTHIPDFHSVLGYSFTDMVYKTEDAGNMHYEYSYPTVMNFLYDDNADVRHYMQPTKDKLYAAKTPTDIEQWTHPLLRCAPSDIKAPLGSSPVYVSMLNTFEPDPYSESPAPVLSVQPSHMGYATENISTYYYLNHFSGTFNGDTVALGTNPWEERLNETIDEWIAYDWNAKGKTKGKCDFSFATAPFTIDSVPCSTTAQVTFNTEKEDFVCPMVQYLTFRDNEGKVNHKIATSANSLMYLVAGDFIRNAEGFYVPSASTLKTMSVKYRHHNDNDFTDMTLQSLGSYSDMPWFAPAYKADLTQLNPAGKTGWFDLQITLEDASGNRISQTIAPAFWVGALSGVATVTDDSSIAIRVIGNDVQVLGADMAAISVYNTLGALVKSANATNTSLEGLAPGVYIINVMANSEKKNVKVMVK